jgi:hypothetical protein
MIAVLAFSMLGAGHGWVNAIFSCLAIILAPLTAVAWAFRDQNRGVILAFSALLPGLIIDFYLCTHTENLDRIWEFAPLILIAWTFMWVAWQVVAVWTMLSKD